MGKRYSTVALLIASGLVLTGFKECADRSGYSGTRFEDLGRVSFTQACASPGGHVFRSPKKVRHLLVNRYNTTRNTADKEVECYDCGDQALVLRCHGADSGYYNIFGIP